MSLQNGVRNRFTSGVLIALLCVFAGAPPALHAENAIEKRVKSKVAPTYPEIAKRMGLTGLVRIQVTVAADGTIKETKVIGGHPILVNAALDAVKKWKFDTAAAETTGILEFKFSPSEE